MVAVKKEEYSRYKMLRDNYMLDLVKKYPFVTLTDLSNMFRLNSSYIKKLLKEMDSKIEVKEKPTKEEDTELRLYHVKILYYQWVFQLFNMGHGYESFPEIFGITDEREAYNFHIEALQFQNVYLQNEGKKVVAEKRELQIQLNQALAEIERLRNQPVTKVRKISVEDEERVRILIQENQNLKSKYQELLSKADLGVSESLKKEIEDLKHKNILLSTGVQELQKKEETLLARNEELIAERASLKEIGAEYRKEIENLKNQVISLSAKEKALDSLLSDRDKEVKSLKSNNSHLLSEKENLEGLYKSSLAKNRELEIMLRENLDDSAEIEAELYQSEEKAESLSFQLSQSEEEIKRLKESKSVSFNPRLSKEEKDLIVWWWNSHGKKLTSESFEEFLRVTGIKVTMQGFRYVVNHWPPKKKKDSKKSTTTTKTIKKKTTPKKSGVKSKSGGASK